MEAQTENSESPESELLILVDTYDQETGSLGKVECHDGDGILHRAFSVFLFNDRGELLLQQRSADKRLWPMYWTNTCCGHPRRGESMQVATERRLQQELNTASTLEFIYKFEYQARFGNLARKTNSAGSISAALNGKRLQTTRKLPRYAMQIQRLYRRKLRRILTTSRRGSKWSGNA